MAERMDIQPSDMNVEVFNELKDYIMRRQVFYCCNCLKDC